ncbi:MAG: maleylacetoacetate isomerase [Alphaproteobacteria bacterium]|nr:maleylacetoacetate isomerase [Alphaproteobacteria bacterium]
MKLVLHGYFRSGTTYRVRLALNWKGLDYDYVPVNLVAGGQREAAYLATNPQGLVPALEAGGDILTQSPAILEWIEETWPDRPLLPADPTLRARVRAFAAVIGCDIHPVQNLRILKAVGGDQGVQSDAAKAWGKHWIEAGYDALETLAADAPGQNGFLFTDAPTMAEIYLIPQMLNARRFGVDLSAYPRLLAVEEACNALPEFQRALPENQPDAG